MTAFTPLPFADRRDYALARLPDGSMLLPASPIRFKNGDSDYRYRPDSELFYLTGWTEPEAVLLLRGFAEEQRFVLFVQERDEAHELWTGTRVGVDGARERYGADAAYPISRFAEVAPDLMAPGDRIYYRLGSSPVADHIVQQTLTMGRRRRARQGRGSFVIADPGAILDDMRLRKHASEIERHRHAAKISVHAFREAIGTVGPGVGEWLVEASLTAGFRRAGADGPAFATIVGSGVNGCTLHYVANSDTIGADDLVLIDAGCEVEGHASDITRTVPAAGRFEGLAADVYAVVLAAQRAALDRCAPGVSLDEVHAAAEAQAVDGLIQLGAVGGTHEQVVAEGSHKSFFPHKTSHWLGLDTHDVGAYYGHEGPTVLAPGMIFTVEPGLYFRPGSCPRRPELEGIGVRIEDDVLIEEDGAEVLTASLPTDAAEVAALVASGGA